MIILSTRPFNIGGIVRIALLCQSKYQSETIVDCSTSRLLLLDPSDRKLIIYLERCLHFHNTLPGNFSPATDAISSSCTQTTNTVLTMM